MPIYKFKHKCGHSQEEILFDFLGWEERESKMNTMNVRCESCGEINSWNAKLCIPSKDETWVTHRHGVDGYFSHALGRNLSGGRREEQKIMAAKGFVCEADLRPHLLEDITEAKKDKRNQQDKYIDKYTGAIAEGKSKEDAIAELAPMEDIDSGKIDKVWSETIDVK